MVELSSQNYTSIKTINPTYIVSIGTDASGANNNTNDGILFGVYSINNIFLIKFFKGTASGLSTFYFTGTLVVLYI